MRFSALSAGILAVCCIQAAGPEPASFRVEPGASPGWKPLLESMGLVESARSPARVIVACPTAHPDLLSQMDAGAVVILEGDSPLARALGFTSAGGSVRIARIRDSESPGLRIRWRSPALVKGMRPPAAARVIATDARTRLPVAASITHGAGAALWVVAAPGEEGFERFPFLPRALAGLGVRSPFESRRLWAFFDRAWRRQADFDALAAQWRKGGIAAIHVGAWDYMEPNAANDDYLTRLIGACHRHAILVYCWLELPHVSDTFWEEHPRCREKTALLKDANIDWRLLMNLADPACNQAALESVQKLLGRFDWDGVNLAEMYFDGLNGVRTPKEFTPMNPYIRSEFQKAHGFDPLDLFRGRRTEARLRQFLDYRADLAARLQEQWIRDLEKMRPLDIVLTHVDDRFDTSMRDAIGADAARVLRLLDDHPITFIVEDPATVWKLGPKRYAEIARRYAPLTSHHDRLGVDINIVERDGRVFPTRKQTGAELLGLIHTASDSFARVMFYFEFSIGDLDWPLLPAASAVVTSYEVSAGGVEIESPYGVGLCWNGPALVDGAPWPLQNGRTVWLPAGRHRVASATAAPPLVALDLNAEIKAARVTGEGFDLAYTGRSAAFVSLNRRPSGLIIDGVSSQPEVIAGPDGSCVIRLPRGEHTVTVY